MEQIRIDIVPKGIMPVCHASQYDKGRVIRCNLMDGLQGYVLTTETIVLNVRKPDDNIVTAAVEVISGKTYVDIVTTEQMTACEGNNICELTMSKDDVVISTMNFKMQVEEDPLKDGIESETEIHNLTTQIQDINAEMVPDMVADEVARQYTGDVIFDDEPTENHGDGYAVNSAGLKAYIPKNIDNLDDVEIDNPASNQALVWDAENNRWTNGEVSTVGSIDDLNDVDTTGKADGNSLRYDNANQTWVAKPTTVACTQAEYDALQLSGDLVPNTHYVITDAQNLNPTASDIEYSGGVTVADKLDTIYAPIKSSEVVSIPNSALSVGSNWGEGCFYVKRNGLVILHLALQGLTANTRNDVYTLPSNCRPSLQIVGAGMGGNSYTAFAQATITTGGVVQVSSVDTYARIHLMYYVNE